MTRDIDIRLFGSLRQFSDQPTITLNLGADATVAALRTELGARLSSDNGRSLLGASAFATDERVLEDGEPLPDVRELAVLPPVCGG